MYTFYVVLIYSRSSYCMPFFLIRAWRFWFSKLPSYCYRYVSYSVGQSDLGHIAFPSIAPHGAGLSSAFVSSHNWDSSLTWPCLFLYDHVAALDVGTPDSRSTGSELPQPLLVDPKILESWCPGQVWRKLTIHCDHHFSQVSCPRKSPCNIN